MLGEATEGTTKRQHPVRRLAVGAEVVNEGVHFRIWALGYPTVEVIIEGEMAGSYPLEPEDRGYFAALVPHIGVGTRYRFRLGSKGDLYPDPVSRYQPEGPHGSSQVIDPATFNWTDTQWKGARAEGQVLYEMHFGTFTPEGTYRAAEAMLPYLAEVGITCLEIMPVAEFAGRFNWGYDGVALFAPEHVYGTPDELRHFVDAAHANGLAVILDVVYNHLGPEGNYLATFAKEYCSEKHKNEWGKPLNFDGPNSHGARELILANTQYWIQEFHMDGFRYDATQALLDESPEHICAAISRCARQAAAPRSVYLVNENEPQHTRLVRPIEHGGMGMDALWNDDFHHTANVALTARNESYFMDYQGSPQELISCAKWGYLYQGQRYRWQKARRGTSALDLPPTAFINYLQNHDQIANSGKGLRLHELTSPQQLRAIVSLTLLMPQTPMLFQGEEFSASSRFLYFADHTPHLARQVRQGRAQELAQFPSLAIRSMQEQLADPADVQTFERSKIDHSERQQPFHAQMLAMYRDLLRLRRQDAVFHRISRRGDMDGAVLGPQALVLRYFGEQGDDRLVLCNYGADLRLDPAPEPLLAPPAGQRWAVIFCSEEPCYDGSGSRHPDTETEGWFLTGRCTTVLKPYPAEVAEVQTRIARKGVAGPRPSGEP
jgi:maltooligosyltrehalose trehalohydrolase